MRQKAFKSGSSWSLRWCLIYAGKYDSERGEKAVAEARSDMVGFGRPFVANPDLTPAFKMVTHSAAHDPNTLFGGAEKAPNGLTQNTQAKTAAWNRALR